MLAFNPQLRFGAEDCLSMLSSHKERVVIAIMVDCSYIRTSRNIEECRVMIEREGAAIQKMSEKKTISGANKIKKVKQGTQAGLKTLPR